MTKEDDVIGAIVGLVLGLFGIAILAEFLKPKCQNCKRSIDQGVAVCPYCGAWTGQRWQ